MYEKEFLDSCDAFHTIIMYLSKYYWYWSHMLRLAKNNDEKIFILAKINEAIRYMNRLKAIRKKFVFNLNIDKFKLLDQIRSDYITSDYIAYTDYDEFKRYINMLKGYLHKYNLKPQEWEQIEQYEKYITQKIKQKPKKLKSLKERMEEFQEWYNAREREKYTTINPPTHWTDKTNEKGITWKKQN